MNRRRRAGARVKYAVPGIQFSSLWLNELGNRSPAFASPEFAVDIPLRINNNQIKDNAASMPPNNFKSDESFLKKLAVGAAGTTAAMRRLSAMGFKPIELERGSSGFKIWKTIKIKRVRVPDILCLKSGWRFESRGKTKLEISMSHSTSDPNRAWDAGMRADDFVVIVLCEQASDSPVDWQPASPLHFIRVDAMRDAYRNGAAKITAPKGVEEGSEIRVIWPSAAANEPSVGSEVTAKGLRLSPVGGGKPQRCMLNRAIPLIPLCGVGDTVARNQIVGAVVPAVLSLSCPADVGEAFFTDKLSSAALSERYAGAKALRFRGFTSSAADLRARLADDAEDIYVKLEASAALAAHSFVEGWDYLELSLFSEFAQVQLETIIVLSEIPGARSQALLIGALGDSSRHEEIRAGAAWALGEFHTDDAARALADTFDQRSLEMRIPRLSGHRFHGKLDTQSAGNWTLIPGQPGHLFQGKLDT